MIHSRRILGNFGEKVVCDFLVDRGFTICAQNFTTRFGEIDIIARNSNLMVCVEVKTRKKSKFPLSAVITHAKQQKIITTAKLFISTNHIIDVAVRFDVAMVIGFDDKYTIDYLENAFEDRCLI